MPSSADNHFEDETEGVVERYVAYSRRRGAPKLYVQDVLKDKGELVWDIVNKRGGSIFVCGAVFGHCNFPGRYT